MFASNCERSVCLLCYNGGSGFCVQGNLIFPARCMDVVKDMYDQRCVGMLEVADSLGWPRIESPMVGMGMMVRFDVSSLK